MTDPKAEAVSFVPINFTVAAVFFLIVFAVVAFNMARARMQRDADRAWARRHRIGVRR